MDTVLVLTSGPKQLGSCYVGSVTGQVPPQPQQHDTLSCHQSVSVALLAVSCICPFLSITVLTIAFSHLDCCLASYLDSLLQVLLFQPILQQQPERFL